MTGCPVLTYSEYSPRRSGTQDLVRLDPAFPWRPDEIASLQRQIAAISNRPLKRVQYVVGLAQRFDFPFRRRFARNAFLPGLSIEYMEYIGHTGCANRTDWMICRAAMEVLAPLETSWKMRRLAAAKKAADLHRLPLRVRRATKSQIGCSKYRGIYTNVAERLGLRSADVRAIGLGKKSDPNVLQELFAEVDNIESRLQRRGN